MIKRTKAFFRQKTSMFRQIKRESSHHILDNGINSIKSTIEGNSDIPEEIKEEILQIFKVIKKPLSDIIGFFDD